LAILVSVVVLDHSRCAGAQALTAVVFPFGFIAAGAEPPRPAELRRLRTAEQELGRLLAGSGRYLIVDSPAAAAEAQATNLVDCQACAAAAAKQLGADVAVIGWVQKVSELILNINTVIRSASTGDVVVAGSVDIRGNTDESWTRGVRYLVANRLLRSPP
jgi:hypothetical protein